MKERKTDLIGCGFIIVLTLGWAYLLAYLAIGWL